MLEERTFETGSTTINFAEGPTNGRPLVLLHGGSARWQFWGPLLEGLVSTNHVYAPDFRGHGGSSWTPGHYRLLDYASDVGAFLREMVREPASLFGHSMGGEVAMIVAAQWPDRIRSVILEDAPLSADVSRRAIESSRPTLLLMRALAGSTLPLEELTQRVGELPVDPSNERNILLGDVASDDDLRMYAESMRQHDPAMLDAVLKFDEMHAGYDDGVAGHVGCPVLILRADPSVGGVLLDADVAHALALMPDARCVRFDGAGHSIHIADPQGVLDVVVPFLDEMGT